MKSTTFRACGILVFFGHLGQSTQNAWIIPRKYTEYTQNTMEYTLNKRIYGHIRVYTRFYVYI